MIIREFVDRDAIKLAAIGQFLLKRAGDTVAVKPMNVDTFINIARDNGINMTRDRLMLIANQPPLSNIIDDIQNDQIIWKGSKINNGDNTMSVDQARQTVDQMAKRAAKKGL
jgi:hypothetical protein